MQWTLRLRAGHHRRVGDIRSSPIRHVLFDADGVLQDVPGGWEAGTEPYLGARTAEFLRRVWDDEVAALTGLLFIDDSARNVAAARDVGLAAEQWTLADGHDRLLGLLAEHGVRLANGFLAGGLDS